VSTLAEIRDGVASGIDLLAVKRNEQLVYELQNRLNALGLLDPPVDGDFGPVSHWAWAQFCQLQGEPFTNRLTSRLSGALLRIDAQSLLPLDTSGSDLATRVARSMEALGYWIARHPDCINIAYLEGVTLEGKANDNTVNYYNDVRCIFCVHQGRAILRGAWSATTQPGWHWILNPSNEIRDTVKAAAHIALGQYKAWCVGTHNAGVAHEALVQRAKIRVHRDQDRNGQREADPIFERADYGINQHHGSNSTKVGAYSAGCLVANSVAGHKEFMKALKKDPRYRSSNAYRFMTSVLGRGQLLP